MMINSYTGVKTWLIRISSSMNYAHSYVSIIVQLCYQLPNSLEQSSEDG